MAGAQKGLVLAATLSMLFLTGCVPPVWSPIHKTAAPYEMGSIQVAAHLPVEWMSSTYEPLTGIWHFTRQGDELNQIYLRRWPKTTVVKGTHRSIRDDMTLQEIANLSLDSRRLDEGTGALEVLSNQPATVGGQNCYRLDYRYRNEIGLSKRTVEYGCPVAGWMYRFEFNAPAQHYFDAGLDDFETMVRSLEFRVPDA